MTGVPVTNLTVESGGSNSEILRRIVEYTWRNEVGRTGFIVQWTEMDRLEYCDGDSEWYQSRQSSQLDGTRLPPEVLLKIKKIQESIFKFTAQALICTIFFMVPLATTSLHSKKN